ncbi:hypothetical protein SBI_10017 [Streptomyces bingchenggensis BCW-1]|uniref:Uncharacterized protein n=1 Tax=Streptomyces bingchenggensis (strain BCW-1) TaxID=749414 RepID=D7CFB9_STRBB|nr:hypothetical protein SBI_10017 [Streptomyces bingchenggensis BCW-1]
MGRARCSTSLTKSPSYSVDVAVALVLDHDAGLKDDALVLLRV